LPGLWAVRQRNKEKTFGLNGPVCGMMARVKNPNCTKIKQAVRKKSKGGLK